MPKSIYCIVVAFLLHLSACDGDSAGKKAAKQKVEELMLEMESADARSNEAVKTSFSDFEMELQQLNGELFAREMEGDDAMTAKEGVHIAPAFPGGAEALFGYLQHGNIKQAGTASGKRIVVSFVIDSVGVIAAVEIDQPSVDEEAAARVRQLIEGMPRWTPAFRNGIPVPVRYYLPVHLRDEPGLVP